MPVPTTSKLPAYQRALYFDQATRKYVQPMATQTFKENGSIRDTIPQSRFLGKITLLVKGTFKLAHATKTTFTPSIFDKWNIIRNVKIDINNGFSPYNVSGGMLKIYNMTNRFRPVLDNTYNVVDYVTNFVSVGGSLNTIAMMVELPITLNNKETTGIINLQYGTTRVDYTIDFAKIASMMTDDDIVVSDIDISITPVVDTFSIPDNADLVPDYSNIKLVQEEQFSVVSNGDTTIKLPIGMTYRRLIMYIATDADGTPIDPANIDQIEILFNQGNHTYTMPADFVTAQNTLDYGASLPLGTYVIAFDTAGIANYSSGRDYVNTDELVEFWVRVRFNNITGNNSYIKIVAEKIAAA